MYFLDEKSTVKHTNAHVSNAPVQIKALIPSRRLDWDNFVQQSEYGSFFHLSLWQDFYEQCCDLETFYFYAEQDNTIIGVLPAARVKSIFFGDAIISTPYCVYGGVIGSTQAKEKLIQHITQCAKDIGVDYVELRQQESLPIDGFKQTLYVTFKKPIADNDEENLKSIPRKQRAVIRKAQKNQLASVWQDNIDDFYELYSHSVRNLGTPVMSKAYYHELFNTFKEYTKVLTIYQNDQPVSSVLSFYYKDSVLPYYGGGGELARDVKANDYMYWVLMQDAASRKIHYFDYGRSKLNTGSYRFKTHWGFEPTPLHYVTIPICINEPPDLNPTNKKYQLMIKAWKKLPLKLSQIIGPFVAKRLG